MAKSNISSLKKECDFLEGHIDEIIQEYGESTYVAIREEKIIDHDANMVDLMVRINGAYKKKPILITSPNEYKEINQLTEKV